MENRNGYEKLTPLQAAKRKRDEVLKALSMKELELSGEGILMTEDRKNIASLSFTNLRNALQEGKLSAIDVLKAFQAKALEETRKTNCITEFIPQAEEWAQERDNLPDDAKKGLLHGIPVSVKENYDVQGMETTMGLTRRLGRVASKHASMIEALLSQGAVPFVKTNIPQLMHSIGCSNPIFGETKNPHDILRSPGGSTGGEGALVGGGGSVIGLGSDLIGSVRIPAAFCGAASIKWTEKRVPKVGTLSPFKATIGIRGSAGLLGRDVQALAVCLQSLLSADMLYESDPTCPPLRWRPGIYNCTRKLKVGWFDTNKFYPTTPGVRRAVAEAKTALEKMGHTTVDFDIPDMTFMYNLTIDFLTSGGGSDLLTYWSGGEIVDDCVDVMKRLGTTPWLIRKLQHTYINMWSPRFAKFAAQDAFYSSTLWSRMSDRAEYINEMLLQWRKADIDILLSPAWPTVAIHPAHCGSLLTAMVYVFIYNLLDFPCGTVPVTVETMDDQKLMEGYPTDDYVFKCIKDTTYGGSGMPLGVQMAALPYKEELLLYAMRQLELGLGKD